jgi:hypothetical protein
MSCARWFLFPVVLSLGAAASSLAADDKPADQDESVLKAAQVATDISALLELLQKRSGNDDDLRRLSKLMSGLGSDDFSEREEASKKLQALGVIALPALRQACASGDAEIARRAKVCVKALEHADDWWMPLMRRRVIGASMQMMISQPRLARKHEIE